MPNVIEVRGLVFEHRAGEPVLRGIDTALQPGCWTALIGANGSGKTTMARCLNGLLLPTAGSVHVDGVEVTAATLREIRRRVAMVFQNPDDQLVAPTVEAELAFGLENLGIEYRAMHERVEALLAAFGLAPHRSHPPHLLSGGQRQRLAVAAAVAVRPRYLVLDEPAALLDAQGRRRLLDLMEDLCREAGLGLLYITQSPEEAARADRILVLHDGRLADDGTPRRIYGRGHTLRPLGLEVPFAVAVAEAAGGGADDALHVGELAPWLARRTRPGPWIGRPSRPLPSPLPPKLCVRGVEYIYDRGLPVAVKALRGVDLDVAPGRLVALLGPSGSGKTTLAQHLNGLLRPSSGRVALDGEDIWLDGDAAAARRQVGLVFQFPETQLFAESVAADVAFGPLNHGCSPTEARERAGAALDAVGLPPGIFGPREPLTLSGGERRRAAIAGVLAIDPAIVVLDEPTAGLDPHNETVVAGLLETWVEAGRGVVLVSHDIDRVAELATDVVAMEAGRVRCGGEVRPALAAATGAVDGAQEPVAAPLALQLSRRLRHLGVDAPDLFTRAEACAWARAVAGATRIDPTNPQEENSDAR